MTAALAPTTEELAAVRRKAVADSIPLAIPALPFGFVLGFAIVESVMPNIAGFLSSPIIMAGAAQLAVITLAGSVSVWAIMATAMVINLRHVMYSAALSPAFKAQPRWFRLLAPIMLIDQVFALLAQRVDDHPDTFRHYYGASAAVFFTVWHIATILGLAFGSVIPESWQLGYAPAVMFTGLVVMGLDRRPAVVAAVVGAGVCFVSLGLPNRSGLLVGALAGVIAGLVADRANA